MTNNVNSSLNNSQVKIENESTQHHSVGYKFTNSLDGLSDNLPSLTHGSSSTYSQKRFLVVDNDALNEYEIEFNEYVYCHKMVVEHRTDKTRTIYYLNYSDDKETLPPSPIRIRLRRPITTAD
ncbi:MAG: hypothetical protein LAT67_10295 [Balneolales bacterium]|nr:hypothetical protein [Balneolales bacterium]